VTWLQLSTVLEIHERLIKATGGNYGLRDEGLLQSALYSPLATFGGEDLYLDFFTKVAVLLHKIAQNHPFVDGNKRTAFVVGITTLELNGYRFDAEQEEVVNFMLEVAQGKVDIIRIEAWIRKHTR